MLDYVACELPPWITYFILSLELRRVKIGRTTRESKERLQTCQVGSADMLDLIGILAGDHEAEFHARFARSHVRGDWFDFSDDLLDFLRAEFGWTPESDTVAAQCSGWTIDGLLRFIKPDKLEVPAKTAKEEQLSACEHIARLKCEEAYNKPGPLRKRLRAAISLMEDWLADDSRCDAMTWPVVPEGLDINCRTAWRYLTHIPPTL